jgi:hypothetical protein
VGGIFGAVFEVHFCTLFGQIFARDLLVLRDFFDVDGGLGPVFRWVFDRTFDSNFHQFGTSRCPLVAYQVVADLACGLVFTPSTSCGLSRGLIMLPGYT